MHKLPQTFNEAIEQVKRELGEEWLEKLRHSEKHELSQLYTSLSASLSKSFKLWSGNPELVQDIAMNNGGSQHIENMLQYLIEALWEILQDELDAG